MAVAGEYMLYVGTHGMENPTRAALLFAAAKAVAGSGTEARVALLGDAVMLIHPGIAEHVIAGKRGSLKDVMTEAVKLGVKIFC